MLRRALRGSALVLGLVGATASACSGPLAPATGPGEPSLAAPSLRAIDVPLEAPAAPSSQAKALDPTLFDPAQVALVLDDPRLTAVRVYADREAFARAAQELAALLAAAPEAAPAVVAVSADDRRAWLYQLGRLRVLAGDPFGAAKAFRDAAATPWLLADYAHLQAAQGFVAAAQFDAALAEANAVSADAKVLAALDLVTADALHGKGDLDGAAARWRAYLARETPREKKPAQWVTVTLRFARALLQRPSEEHASEAIRLARRVMYESSGAGVGEAKDLERDALATLPHARRTALDKPSSDELLARAKGLAAAGQGREAVLVTDKLVRLPRSKKPGEFACETWMARADALVKMKKRKVEAAEAYDGAIDRCAGQPRRVEALFAGGKASASAGRQAEAMQRFAHLETEFPGHRLADDARVRGARAALDGGDETRFEQLLGSAADDYPGGDVVNDGLFELALHRIGKRDWAGALSPLDRALARSPRERAYFAAGRLPYFVARAHLATGATEKGLTELAGVIRDYPLSYYMALAYARLAERDARAADRALAEALAAEPEGAFTLTRGPWSDDPTFLRAVELLRQGDAKLARLELDALGVGARTAPREVLWAAAFLLARTGAVTSSHGLLRSGMASSTPAGTELLEWLEHYPVGRWRAAWELAYPRPWASVVAKEAKRQGLPDAWAYAIMREESAFEPRATSPSAAFGLMQLIVPTAKQMAKPLGLPGDEESLKRPEVNIALGCRYLAVLRRQFADNPLLAIPGYNAGGGAPKKWVKARPDDDFDLWVERIPYEETRFYTKRVITSLASYEFLYARNEPSEALRTPLPASPSAKSALAAAAP